VKVAEIAAKSILVRSKLPDTEYVVNPYKGRDCTAYTRAREREQEEIVTGGMRLRANDDGKLLLPPEGGVWWEAFRRHSLHSSSC